MLMNKRERRAVATLSSIMALRMIGLFLILPIFSLYADKLPDVTPLLIGLAIGAYGLTQAILQIPFGLLSDRFGRKTLITIGLLIFALGSFIAAHSDNHIVGIIIGRVLQGAGAISAVLMALMSDLVREQHRTKAMAGIGISIGIAFLISLIIAPWLNNLLGMAGIFNLIGVLALVAVVFLHWFIPSVPVVINSDLSWREQFSKVLKHRQLLRLDISIFLLHLQLTALFIVFPLALSKGANIAASGHSWVYLTVLPVTFILMIPFIIIAEKRQKMQRIFIGAIAVLGLSQLGFALLPQQLLFLMILLGLFFTVFNIAEAILPSWISKIAPADSKGTAMGVYASSQFLGAFIGGIGGGWLYQSVGMSGLFFACVGLNILWLLIAIGLQQPIKKT